MIKFLPEFYDGATLPVLRFKLQDAGGARSTLGLVVNFYFVSNGQLIARRPGKLVSPQTGGLVDVYIRGRELDWDGAGKKITVYPRVFAPVGADGSIVSNLLLDPSFESDGNADGVADNWSLTAGSSAAYSLISSGEPLFSIFGGSQQVVRGGAGTDSLTQVVATSLVAGDLVTAGVWVRMDDVTGTADGNEGLILAFDGAGETVVQPSFGLGSGDWRFISTGVVATSAHSQATVTLATKGPHTGTWQFDEAALFKGEYGQLSAEPFLLPVRPRMRPSKTGANLLAGIGSFEQDSNADGVADGWTKNGSGNTFSLDATPANVQDKKKSKKVVLANASTSSLSVLRRGHFKSGETWQASVRYKNGGALTGAPASGAFALQLRVAPFDDQSKTAGNTDITTANTAAFTTITVTKTLTADVDRLEVLLQLNSVTGTAWFDNVQLTRI